jgi:hypothetical protein
VGLYAFVLWRHPSLWLFAIPALLPVLDLATWSRRFFFGAFDFAVWGTWAVLLLRPAEPESPKGKIPAPALWLFGLFAFSALISFLVGLLPYDDAKPGAAVAVQSFGDFQNFHPHLHVLTTDGCFYNEGAFIVCSPPDSGELEELFRYEVFKLLKAEGKINDAVIKNMMYWRHSGFNVYCGSAIWPHNQQGLENLARYIIRASFSQERMTYIAAGDSSDGVAKVIYESKNGKTTKTFDALAWLAQLVTHIPNKGEQMVRYYGFQIPPNLVVPPHAVTGSLPIPESED